MLNWIRKHKIGIAIFIVLAVVGLVLTKTNTEVSPVVGLGLGGYIGVWITSKMGGLFAWTREFIMRRFHLKDDEEDDEVDDETKEAANE